MFTVRELYVIMNDEQLNQRSYRIFEETSKTFAMKKFNQPEKTRKTFIFFIVTLLLCLALAACHANDPEFDDQGILQYGDLQVKITEHGFDTYLDGWYCSDDDYAHPYLNLDVVCAENAQQSCAVDVVVEVKYEDGSSWGRTYFKKSYSSTEFRHEGIHLKPGKDKQITFRPTTRSKDCWLRQPVKRITVTLRDKSGEMKNLSASIQP